MQKQTVREINNGSWKSTFNYKILLIIQIFIK